jgi:hypothetical protein
VHPAHSAAAQDGDPTDTMAITGWQFTRYQRSTPGAPSTEQAVTQRDKEQEDFEMADTTVADDRANDFATFHATQADMSATVVGRPRGDSSLINIITYSEGQFTLRFAPGKPGDVAPTIVEIPTPRQLSALLDALQDELDNPPTDQKLDLAARIR